MVLIYLLLALSAERLIDKPKYCQTEFYYDRYMNLVARKKWLVSNAALWQVMLVWLAPVGLMWAVLYLVDIGIVHFIVTLLVLFVSIGCVELRASFKCYLAAAEQGDVATCKMHTEALGLTEHDSRSFGQHLIWLNYQRYAAPIIFFVLLGLPGVVAYSMLRILNHHAQSTDAPYQYVMAKIVLWVDWLPIRITAFGFLMMGHFSRALPKWLGFIFDFHTPAKNVLGEVAVAAEDVSVSPEDLSTEAITLVKLAKRNILFLLALIAILTLSGFIL